MSDKNPKNLPMIDGVEMHDRNPDTFMIPSDVEKINIEAGDHVKIGFIVINGSVGAERMWVKVIDLVDDVFIGSIANDPVFIKASYLDLVRFKSENILGIIKNNNPTVH